MVPIYLGLHTHTPSFFEIHIPVDFVISLLLAIVLINYWKMGVFLKTDNAKGIQNYFCGHYLFKKYYHRPSVHCY